MSEIRRAKAKCAASGGGELDRNCPLRDGERVLGGGRLQIRRGWRSPLGYYRVKNERVCLITHRALGADELMEIPRSMIDRVEPPGSRGRIALHCSGGTDVELRPFSWSEIMTAAAAANKFLIPSTADRDAAALALFEALTAE